MTKSSNTTLYVLGGLGVLAYLYRDKIAQAVGGVVTPLPNPLPPSNLSPCTVASFTDVNGRVWPASPHGIWNAQLNHCEPTGQHPAYANVVPPGTGGIRCPHGQSIVNGQCVTNTPSNTLDNPLRFRLA